MPPSDYNRLLEALQMHVNRLAHLYIWPQWLSFSTSENTVRGGYGVVQFAQLARPGWPPNACVNVAVKRLQPVGDHYDRLRVYVALGRELAVWALLEHPNIARLVGFHIDVARDEAWLISIWEPHGNIVAYLKNNIVKKKKRLELAEDTARGLRYLHGRKVCHGDLKGLNILVNQSGRAVICDLGTARVMESGPSGLTTSKGPNGTNRYLSPELLDGEHSTRTFSSDVWAWGCVFYEIMTGGIPYQQERTDV